MKGELIEKDGARVYHVTATDAPIRTRDDALALLFGHGQSGLAGIAIDDGCFHPDFFRLKTGIAGEILQMFVNYRSRLAIIGDFSKYPGDSLRDFIGECNRGRQTFFVAGIDEAVRRLRDAKRGGDGA